MNGPSAKTIHLDGLVKSYDQTKVLHGVDLEVHAGEFMAMLGPSGSGKTTILKIIAGFEEADHGSVTIDGRVVTGVAPENRNIGVVFQNYSLFPHMTVAANVGFPLRMRGVARIQRKERIRQALELVALQEFGDRIPSQLSGGQQQRVAIARAIVFEPDILLMDEPLGALDRRLREDMQTEIKALHERLGITIVYVTHDQEEALSMSDRIAVFNRGRVEQIGTPREIYRSPKTVFVADFLGDSLYLLARMENGSFTLGGNKLSLELPCGKPTGSVRLLWRSDELELCSAPEHLQHQDGKLTVPATVLSTGYTGTASRLRVLLSTGETGTVSAPEETKVAVGDRIGIQLDLDRVVALTENDRTGT